MQQMDTSAKLVDYKKQRSETFNLKLFRFEGNKNNVKKHFDQALICNRNSCSDINKLSSQASIVRDLCFCREDAVLPCGYCNSGSLFWTWPALPRHPYENEFRVTGFPFCKAKVCPLYNPSSSVCDQCPWDTKINKCNMPCIKENQINYRVTYPHKSIIQKEVHFNR